MVKRVALFLPSLVGGGAERSAIFVGEVLVRAGYAVDLVVAHAVGPLLDHPFARAHLVRLGAPSPLLALPHYRRYLRRARPDLVISFVHSANLLSGLAARTDPTPFVVSIRSTLEKRPREQWWVRRAFGFALERRLYRRARFIQTVSQEVAEECRRRFAVEPERLWVTYSTVIDATATLPGAADDRAGIAALAPFLLSVGRLVPIKGFATLIRAFARAPLPPELKLVILGEGPDRARLEALAGSLGVGERIVLAGWQPDSRPWLAAARGFVFASHGEGLSRAVLEAAEARLPIAASRVAGVTEAVDGGALGRLLAPDDIDGFAQAMADIATGALASPPADATARHLARFTPEAVGASYVEMVRACIDPASCVAD